MKKLFLIATLLVGTLVNSFANGIGNEKKDSVSILTEDIFETNRAPNLKYLIKLIETDNQIDNSLNSQTRLGIIYHEAARNHDLFSKIERIKYANKSIEIFDRLRENTQTNKDFLPLISSYRASAIFMNKVEKSGFGILKIKEEYFSELDLCIEKYGLASAFPEFLRGIQIKKLPQNYITKRRNNNQDFLSIFIKSQKKSGFVSKQMIEYIEEGHYL